MIDPKELVELKQRILLAAEVNIHLANSDGEFMELEPEQYEIVYEAMTSLKEDSTRVLAELDVLRGMFADRVGAFFMEFANGAGVHGGHGGSTLAGVPEGKDLSSGEEARPVATEGGGGTGRGGDSRKPRKRSNARRNRKGDGADTGDVDSSAGTRPMDRGA